ncbi:kinase-like protein [Calocera cornea HHB12733]|uniref:Kinase-like protein n=1 Tax=Calocera cornea HHB12733 TaxID=1353952 RepID=A0A165DBE1_9BASI|nr:kinase-like protein [Calocera cornea HHB12733]
MQTTVKTAIDVAQARRTARPSQHTPTIATSSAAAEATSDANAPYSLNYTERNWAWMSGVLEKAGYRLRPRYRKGWVGSWVGTKKKPELCEDSIYMSRVGTIMDAVRISDGRQVLLKLWNDDVRDGPELAPLRYFSDPVRRNDPRNHVVPLLDRFSISTAKHFFKLILVEPLLRDWGDPPFVMVAEALQFMLQLIEGLEYLHEHRVAHGDIHSGNIMMDPSDLFPDGFHGAFNWNPRREQFDKHIRKRSRLETPVKYYYIDFGSSVQYKEPQDAYLVAPGWTVWQCPEMAGGQESRYDPFKADVYALGLTLLFEINRRTGLEFVIPTLIDMISENPDARPTMKDVRESFKTMLSGLTAQRMRRRIGWPDDEDEDPLAHIRDWGEYLRLLRQSYWYGLPKDILPEPKKTSSWLKRFQLL